MKSEFTLILLLFTSSYPYDVAIEQTFLGEEIKHLVAKFDRVILVPRTCKGNRLPLPARVEVDQSFSTSFTLSKRVFAGFVSLFSGYLYEDVKRHWPESFSPSYARRLVAFLGDAYLTRLWVQGWFRQQNISSLDALFYTFWFDDATMGIGMAKESQPGLRLVSRTHGYDLYEEIYGVWPCRFESISLLDGLFPDSDAGKKYLSNKYPDFSGRYDTALLGVPDPGDVSKPSKDETLRIVSCSLIHPIKRIDLLFEGIVRAARMRPEKRIEWWHYGNGDSRADYVKRISNEFPVNATGHFPGYTTQKNLIHDYLTHPVDIFVNVSETEGTPVSMLEAISCGIPVIATAVGGNTEVVSERNGFLLGQNPTPQQVAEALLKVFDLPELMIQKRLGSINIWQERYNATANFESFAEHLVAIRRN